MKAVKCSRGKYRSSIILNIPPAIAYWALSIVAVNPYQSLMVIYLLFFLLYKSWGGLKVQKYNYNKCLWTPPPNTDHHYEQNKQCKLECSHNGQWMACLVNAHTYIHTYLKLELVSMRILSSFHLHREKIKLWDFFYKTYTSILSKKLTQDNNGSLEYILALLATARIWNHTHTHTHASAQCQGEYPNHTTIQHKNSYTMYVHPQVAIQPITWFLGTTELQVIAHTFVNIYTWN